MKTRRITIAGLAVLVIAGGALWAGVALGSSSSRQLQKDPPRPDTGVRASFKCSKANACVNWGFPPPFYNVFTIFGSYNVVSVTHPSTGTFCVVFAPKVKLNSNSVALTTIDYTDSPDVFMVAMQSYDPTGCPAHSIKFYTMHYDSGIEAFKDEGANVVLP